MDEREFGEMGLRLRAVVAGPKPLAPQELLDFVDTVPGRHRLDHPAGFRLLGIAAVLVMLLAGMQLFGMGIGPRSVLASPTATATSSPTAVQTVADTTSLVPTIQATSR